jgi:hypothetical protein
MTSSNCLRSAGSFLKQNFIPSSGVPRWSSNAFDTHIALEAEARAVGRNKWFSTSAATRETAIRSMAADFKKFERAGMNNNKVAEVIAELVGGACGFLFNAPLDMLIERRIKGRLSA